MDFETILTILDSTLRQKLGTDQANEFLIDFMKRSIATGVITITVANGYLFPYGCSIKKECWGCKEDQPNQLAHMDPGGCLYVSEIE
jgi:hypothetical protein